MPTVGAVTSALASIRARIAGNWPEAVALVAILCLASYLRLDNLQDRAGWDTDQGSHMLALWNAIHTGTLPALGPASSIGNFHHGPMFYYLMLPAAWLGGGAPTWVLVETALAGVTVIPMVWWVARSIGGPVAGLAAALLAATSGGLVLFSTFIWNPTIVEPGAALALLGAWQAWSSRKPVWLLVAAAGTAIAIQTELPAGVLVVPMGLVFAALLKRGPAGKRRQIALWGFAAITLVVATYLPFILYEFGHHFSETRAILHFVTGPSQEGSHGIAFRLVVSALRIVAWPLTGWPLWRGTTTDSLAIGLIAAAGFTAVLGWRLAATTRLGLWRRRAPRTREDDPTASEAETRERDGILLVAGGLAAIIVVLALGVSKTSSIGPSLGEQHHNVADPFVIVGAAIALGSLWRLASSRRWIRLLGRIAVVAVLVLATYHNSGQWWFASNGSNWATAQAVAGRLERDAGGRSIALVGLPVGRPTDIYSFPLVFDGDTPVASDGAGIVVLLCDATLSSTCGGSSEDDWVAANSGASGFSLIDRFGDATNKIMSVYSR